MEKGIKLRKKEERENEEPFLGLEEDIWNSFDTRKKKIPLRYYRLLDIFSLFLVAYFFIISWFLPTGLGKILIIPMRIVLPRMIVDKLLLPVFISLLWFFIISQERERLARGLFIFQGLVSRLSLFQKAFYGINIFIALLLFILPLSSILITILLVFYIPYQIASKIEESKKIALVIFFVVFFLFGILAFISLPKLVALLVRGWLQQLFLVWIAPYSVSIIYDLSLSIGGAGSIGSFILFIYQGAHEYDQSIRIPHFLIGTLEIGLSISFSTLTVFIFYYYPSIHSMLQLVFSGLLLMYTFERLLRWIKDFKKHRRNPLGNASLLLFFLLSLIGIGASNFAITFLTNFGISMYPDIFKIGSMLSATLILVITFLFSLIKASVNKKEEAHSLNFQ